MYLQSILVVALAAPVWSRACGRPTTTITSSSVAPSATAVDEVADAAVDAVEAVVSSATAAVEAATTYAAITTYAVSTQTSQTTTAAATASATSSASTPGRAVWLWESNLIQDDTEVEEFLSFAESNDINTVYTLIDRDMGFTVFQDFIEQCTAAGIAVEALMGNSEWILGEGDPTLEHELTWLEQYQGNATTSTSFAGIHFDVEPWGLDGWTSNEETYTATLQSIVLQVTSLGSTLGLPVAADLPYWADTINCTATSGAIQTLDAWMLDQLDTATFMTYRNTATELLDIATSVLEAGNSAGKPVWLAVETVDAADALLISYFGKTLSVLSSDLVTIHTQAATYSSFAGIAIHDYSGVKALSS
ncbi:hypothetical protein PFICI_11609 [Pestalotiopsis fici W106-1]|uniref:Uncharacterized protein n=1 Tax=Pestalotiopsis fici (strain W106-1 / CGMCC3.15140) TaxID=1229662 RepID=W3WSX2_PESFW|nr:uncharacterized protein PFICI_11609 [Pestalotiopsis fici W106-1]ETS76222.1 hypothetical protein PFICI_11609 [Pestalotiopsis fici W106-1]